MKIRTFAMWLLICVHGVALAEEPVAPLPKTQPGSKVAKFRVPPQQAPARLDDQGQLVYWDVDRKGDVTAYTIPLEEVRFFTVDGQDVFVAEAAQRLATWSPVLIARGNPIGFRAMKRANLPRFDPLESHVAAWKKEAPAWKCFKPDALVAVVPREATGIGTPLDRKAPVPPTWTQVVWNQDGPMSLCYVVFKPVWETRTKTNVDPISGQTLVMTYKICTKVPEYRVKEMFAGDGQFHDFKGSPIPSGEYPSLFTTARFVLTSCDGKPIHSLFLRDLKDDTLVSGVLTEKTRANQ